VKVERPAFKSPLIVIDRAFPDSDADAMLAELIRMRGAYQPATVFRGPGGREIVVDPDFRLNEVVYLDAGGISPAATALRQWVWSEEMKALWHEGDTIFDIINYSTSQEITVARSGHGSFFRQHRDTRQDIVCSRLVSMVLYFNKRPQAFTGGELQLWKDGDLIAIPAKHNRAVVFPSFTFHEIKEVSLPEDTWENGRFSINYWFGFKG
jgi:hypothetical protein